MSEALSIEQTHFLKFFTDLLASNELDVLFTAHDDILLKYVNLE
ncbi:MAG: hypothetical protein ACXAD7_19480 [Candidatus Kariarchaeaceae archaeon]